MPQIAIAMPETINVLGAPMTVLGEGGPILKFVVDHTVPSGYGVPLHRHEDEDEVFFILEGEVTLLDGQGETRAKAGALVSMPSGVYHGYRNDTQNTARMLVICGQRAAEMFRHLDRANPDPEETPAICDQYGVTFAPPTAL